MGDIRTVEVIDESMLEGLFRLSAAHFREYEGHDATSRVESLTPEHIHNFFSFFVGRPDRRAEVALAGDQMVGYIAYHEKQRQCFYEIKSVGEISGLFVDPAYRGEGIGTALLERAKEFFRVRRIAYYALYLSGQDRSGIEGFERRGMYVNTVVLHGRIAD